MCPCLPQFTAPPGDLSVMYIIYNITKAVLLHGTNLEAADPSLTSRRITNVAICPGWCEVRLAADPALSDTGTACSSREEAEVCRRASIDVASQQAYSNSRLLRFSREVLAAGGFSADSLPSPTRLRCAGPIHGSCRVEMKNLPRPGAGVSSGFS